MHREPVKAATSPRGSTLVVAQVPTVVAAYEAVQGLRCRCSVLEQGETVDAKIWVDEGLAGDGANTARTYGTSAPAARALLEVATPNCPVRGQRAAMENVKPGPLRTRGAWGSIPSSSGLPSLCWGPLAC